MSKFIKSLKSMDLVDKKALYKKAKDSYYNEGNSTMTDAEFDALEDSIRSEQPEWVGLKKTGIKPKAERVGKKTDIKLTVPMPSLDKIQSGSEGGLNRWVASLNGEHVVIGAKYDGSSMQGEWIFGKLTKLVTRGDGEIGKDVSYFIPHVDLPLKVKAWANTQSVVIRFEAVCKTKTWAKRWSEEYDSARAMASSVFNRQDVAPAMADINFIALRVLQPSMSLSVGLARLAKLGFSVQSHTVVGSDLLTDEHLVKHLEKLRNVCLYETDGLAIFSDAEKLVTTTARPKYARAFKVNDEANAPLTVIKAIKWQPSRHGKLVPKAIIEPIKFGGVTVKQAALHNAKWALDRGCGVGATVRVLRSGDIIPKIVAVEKKKAFALPSIEEFGDYTWDETETTLVLIDSGDNSEVRARRFVNFFQKLGLEDVSGGMAKKLVEAGYEYTWQLTKLTEKDFAALPGVKTSAKKYASQIQRVRDGEFTMTRLMMASGVFGTGAGSTRLNTLAETHPKLFQLNVKDVYSLGQIEELTSMTRGCGPAFAKVFVTGLPKFFRWLDKSSAQVAAPASKKKAVSGKLSGKFYSWTGYRSKEEEAIITSLGGEVVSLCSKTNVLFFNPDGKFQEKVEKARAKGIKVIEFKELKGK